MATRISSGRISSYLVNPAYVTGFERRKDTGVCFFDGTASLPNVPVSRSRLSAVRSALVLCPLPDPDDDSEPLGERASRRTTLTTDDAQSHCVHAIRISCKRPCISWRGHWPRKTDGDTALNGSRDHGVGSKTIPAGFEYHRPADIASAISLLNTHGDGARDILGLGMFDSCEIRIHPTGSAIARLGSISQCQGHATTFAQIIASEIGIPADDITLEEGDTDTAPYGLGTYGSRSTPVAGAATAMAARKIRAKTQMIAAYRLKVHDDDVEFDVDRFVVKGNPERFKTMKEIAFASYNQAIPGLEPGLEAVSYCDPPNMTYPFGAYICVMVIDVDTGEHEIRKVYALDDCGTRINPMTIDGQVHGGCTEGYAIAMGQEIACDEMGKHKSATLMDFLVPTAVETPVWTTDFTVPPSPHHPIGEKGVGERPNVGSVPAFSNAVHDAFRPFGLVQSHMPHDHGRIWKIARNLGLHG